MRKFEDLEKVYKESYGDDYDKTRKIWDDWFRPIIAKMLAKRKEAQK
jgi:hypothetical protein